MNNHTTKSPKVFISYSWSSEKLKNWVKELATYLRGTCGIDVILDIWEIKPGNEMTDFMERSVMDADKVLIICDKSYKDKADYRKPSGVSTETQIISPEVYANTRQEKFIPIFYEKDENGAPLIPQYLKNRLGFELTSVSLRDNVLRELVKHIYGMDEDKPPLGPVPAFINDSNLLSTASSVAIDNEKAERIIWFLPRGFFLLKNVTYRPSSSWKVIAHYFTYEGKKISSVKYHPAKEEKWLGEGVDVIFKSLCIPISDYWYFHECLEGLFFIKEIRQVNGVLDLKEKVQNKCKLGYHTKYYNSSETIYLPEVPARLRAIYDTRKFRDICYEIEAKFGDTYFKQSDSKHLFFYTDVMILEIHNAAKDYFGEQHPSYKALMEIIGEEKSNISVADTMEWLKRVKKLLEMIIADMMYKSTY